MGLRRLRKIWSLIQPGREQPRSSLGRRGEVRWVSRKGGLKRSTMLGVGTEGTGWRERRKIWDELHWEQRLGRDRCVKECLDIRYLRPFAHFTTRII